MTSTALDRGIGDHGCSYLLTRGNARLRLRQVRVTDGPLLAAFFAGLSPEDRRFRFLDSRKAPSGEEIAAMVEVDHRRCEHVLAFDTCTGELVASLMLSADAPMDTAEVAIAVASGWRNRGIGWALLRHASDLALVRGVRTLRCLESMASHDALEVERSLGFKARSFDGEPGMIVLEARLA